MKVTIKKELLEDQLQHAARFTSSRVSAVQSIQGAKLSAEKDTISITTTNLSDFFHTHADAKVHEPGECVFEVKKALEFLNFLQPGDIDIVLDGTTLTFTQGKTQGHFNLYASHEFPELPHLDGKVYSLSSSILQKLPLVLFSSSKDESRPVMTGVYITGSKDLNFFVTTDGFRLSLLEAKLTESFPHVILPSSVFSEVNKLTKGEGVSLMLSPGDRLIKFTIGPIELYSRVIEGEFPPYEKVIPQSATTSIIVNTKDFIKNMRLVSVFAREQADVVILDISEEGILIKPKSTSKKNSHVFQPIEGFEGEPLKIAFNYKYILDFLNIVQSETVMIECTQPTAPGAFKSSTEPGYVHVIMPLRTEETTG